MRWLASFVAVAHELNYSRAAESLHLSQPAVSQHIRQLEASVRVKVVERSTRAVALTRAGLAFLPLAQDVLARTDQAVRAARNSERNDHGIVRIGFAGGMSAPAVADISRLVRCRHPGIELRFTAHLGSAQVMDLLTTDALDIGFTAGQRTVHALRARVVADDAPGIAVATDHPLTAAPSVELASLADEPFVLVDAANGLRLREKAIEARIDVGFPSAHRPGGTGHRYRVRPRRRRGRDHHRDPPLRPVLPRHGIRPADRRQAAPAHLGGLAGRPRLRRPAARRRRGRRGDRRLPRPRSGRPGQP
ncbi:LysR family transcriptional regulator [Sinomonas cellulolyticus]|uniref:LysR family transcriptional regulator n=1 Tax=Sinomonas cellulolyticus TaxID=2801916 RepID=UPI001E5FFF37|nr:MULTISPECIES: LysR family transcriptional regulator [Sinomonas]